MRAFAEEGKVSPCLVIQIKSSGTTRRALWRSVRLLAAALYFLAAFPAPSALGPGSPGSAQKPRPLLDQHFVCNTGYSRESCHQQCEQLAACCCVTGPLCPQTGRGYSCVPVTGGLSRKA